MRRPRPRSVLVVLAAALVTTAPACSGDGDGEQGIPVATTQAPVSLDDVRVDLEEVARADQPVAMAARPGTDALYVAERKGRVRVLRPTDDGWALDDGAALDLTDRVGSGGLEQGLLGLAFSADGDTLYADFTDLDGTTRIEAFTLDGDTVDPDGTLLLEIAQPAANHNGGQLALGPDGMLYIGMGDGGNQADPDGNGQNPDALLGKVLRIDPTEPSDGRPYGIPDGNPFADGGGAPEVYLWGVRNPWRFSFDTATGDLWLADVGGSQVEEITLLPAADGAGEAANLGWDRIEGTLSHEGDPPAEHVLPLHTYDHDDGRCSITGGFVYRGSAIPDLAGVYLFGDFCGGALRGLMAPTEADGDVQEGVIGPEVGGLASFGQTLDGELFVLSLDGAISRIVAA